MSLLRTYAETLLIVVFYSGVGEGPKDLQRGHGKLIPITVILPSLADTDKSEAPMWQTADRKVAGHMTAIQGAVAVLLVKFHPRAIAPIV